MKRRWWNFVPLVVCVGIFLVPRLLLEYHEDNLIFDFADLGLYILPGSFSLLFARRGTVQVWLPFWVLFMFFTLSFLQGQASGSLMFGSPRGWLGLYLGLAFSLITVLWVIIHTLIIRHNEKKNAHFRRSDRTA